MLDVYEGWGGGFEVVFFTEAGLERRVPWELLPQFVSEVRRPVRSFRSYRGQRNFPGWYWSATVGRRIGFESWVERDHLVALDFDPAAVDIVSQPFWLVWHGADGKRRRHAPDFLVRLEDNQMLVLDSRPFELIEDRDRQAFRVTATACSLVDWDYAVWDRVDPVVAANQRWLAGYRHPRCFHDGIAERLLEVFSAPGPLMAGAEAVGDPLGTLPVLYHLLWRHQLVVDLSLALSDRTVVRVAPTQADAAEFPDFVAALRLAGGW